MPGAGNLGTHMRVGRRRVTVPSTGGDERPAVPVSRGHYHGVVQDPELRAMASVEAALDGLDAAAAGRVLQWAWARSGAAAPRGTVAGPGHGAPAGGPAAVPAPLPITAEARFRLGRYRDVRSVAFADDVDAQAVILMAFLRDELGIQEVAPDDLGAVWSAMGWQKPANVAAVLDAAAKRTKRVTRGTVGGTHRLTPAGERFGRYESLNADAT